MTMSGSSEKTITLPVIPLRNMVLFPGVVQPIDVGRPRSLVVAEKAAQEAGLHLAVVTQRVPELEDPTDDDVYTVGVEAEVLRVMKIAANRATVVARGLRRIKLIDLEERDDGAVWGTFEAIAETGSISARSRSTV